MKVLYNNIIFYDGKSNLFYDGYEEMCKNPAGHMTVIIKIPLFSVFMLNDAETHPFCSITMF